MRGVAIGRAVTCAALLALPLLGACDLVGGTDSWTQADSAGVTIHEYDVADRTLAVEASERFSLGGEPDGPESFYQIYPQWVSAGVDGRIAVLHSQAYRVEVFDADGRHLRSLGRQGEGPGELSVPSAVVVRSDGEVGVYDYAKRALVRFDRMSVPLDQTPVSVPFNGYQGMVATPGGTLLLSRTAPRGDGEVTQRLLHLTASDTTQLGPTVVAEANAIEYPSCRVRMTLPPLFAPEPRWASNGRRTVLVTGAQYDVRVFDDGTLTRILRRAVAPEAVTPGVAERELGEGERWSVGGQECVVPPAELIEARGHAELLPVIDAVAVSLEGEVWVKRRVPGTADRVVDVYAAHGDYLGTITDTDVPFPAAFLPGGRMATIETDAMDLSRVVVWDVEVGGG